LQLKKGELQNLKRRETQVIEAYDYALRGMKETQLNTMEGSALARYCLERALELDAEYATAYARLAFNYIFHWIQRWSTTAEDSLAAVRLLCLCGFSARLFMYFAQSCTVFCSTLRMPVSENIAQK
jgi:hypothetical protein